MRIGKKTLVLFLTAGLSVTSSIAAEQVTELSQQLIEKKISTLQSDGVSDDDEALSGYRKAGAWLSKAATHKNNEISYVTALTNGPIREAETVARMETAEQQVLPSDDDYKELSYQELKALLVIKKSALAEATSARENIEKQLAARETNARQIRDRLTAINLRVSELPDSMGIIDPMAPPTPLEAQQWETASELHALSAERRELEARLSSQSVRYSNYRVEREELTQRVDRRSQTIRVLEEVLARSELSGVNLDDIAIDSDDPAFPIAQKLVASGIHLKEQTVELADQLKTTLAQRDEVNRRSRLLNERFTTARRIVDFASDSQILGNILLVYWHEIPTFEMADMTGELSRTTSDTVINRIGHEKDRLALVNAPMFVARQIDQADIDPSLVTEDVRDILVDLTRSIRDRLSKTITMESAFIEASRGLDTGYRRLTQLIDEYRTFLGGLILWVPSRPSVLDLSFRGLPDEIAQLTQTLKDLRAGAARPVVCVIWFLCALGLLLLTRRIKSTRTALNKKITRLRDDSIHYTVGALMLSALRALPLPLLLMAFSALFSRAATPFAGALSNTFESLVAVSFALVFIRVVCEKSGVARVHFQWTEAACDRMENQMGWLIRWCLPTVGLTLIVLQIEAIDATLGRLMLLLIFAFVSVREIRELRRPVKPDQQSVMIVEPRRVRWIALFAMGMLFLAIADGHIYSVGLVVQSGVDTLWVIIIFDLLYALLMRWLNIARRRLHLKELLASRKESEGSDSGLDDDQLDLGELSATTSQLVKVGIAAAGIVTLVYIWSPLLPMLDVLEKVTLWTTSSLVDGEPVISPITLETLVIVLFLGLVTFYGARTLPALVELVMRSRAGITTGTYYTASTLLSYLIISSGTIAVASTLGLNWSQLQWLVAALGVGIGFGLQEIVANFFSGLIILFERPIRVGDVVTVGESEGVVTRIRIRATTIRDWDGKELLVPNKEFITGRLLNWTLSDSTTRIVVNVGIAYGSNVEQALTILNEVVVDHADVLDEPPPMIIFNEFGDNALQLSARCFVRSFDDRWPVLTALHRMIYARFEEAGIVISFPQHDVHFDSEKPIRIAIEDGQAAPGQGLI
ncbi:MAG: hypothetical protein DRR06_02015 [Gammaproteobacteria bacterium]|nr:MAG: hypothetical protein DRR06_02015 [Gammaproteobacteria bacterium]